MSGFKERLRDLREIKGLNQEDLAEYLGVARTTYSNYERGEREPDIQSIIDLASFHEVSIDYLLNGENKIDNIEQIATLLEELRVTTEELDALRKRHLKMINLIDVFIKSNFN